MGCCTSEESSPNIPLQQKQQQQQQPVVPVKQVKPDKKSNWKGRARIPRKHERISFLDAFVAQFPVVSGGIQQKKAAPMPTTEVKAVAAPIVDDHAGAYVSSAVSYTSPTAAPIVTPSYTAYQSSAQYQTVTSASRYGSYVEVGTSPAEESDTKVEVPAEAKAEPNDYATYSGYREVSMDGNNNNNNNSEVKANANAAYHGYRDVSTDNLPASAAKTVATTSSSSPNLAASASGLDMSSAVYQRNWNEEFQVILDQPMDVPEAKLQRIARVNELTADFAKQASHIVKVIVDELHLPHDAKTIKPVNVGGIAGGEKYIVGTMFVKFSLDFKKLYGGDENAMKASSCELKGLKAYISLGSKLHGPLMVLVDYCGFRLTVSSLLPLSKGSLIYGSDDQCRTVHFDSQECNELMKEAATTLNLKGHYVGENRSQMIYSCGDIEVHRGNDSRYYVIDTARVFPPEAPRSLIAAMLMPASGQISTIDVDKNKLWQEAETVLNRSDLSALETDYGMVFYITSLQQEDFLIKTKEEQRNEENKSIIVNNRVSLLLNMCIRGDALIIPRFRGQHLYNLLRSEFVSQFRGLNADDGAGPLVPLSSDAFTFFGRDSFAAHNADVRNATKHLVSYSIKKFADECLSPSNTFTTAELISRLHQSGINCRYLGTLRSIIRGKMNDRNLGKKAEMISRALLTEMVARVWTGIIRAKLRSVQLDASEFKSTQAYLAAQEEQRRQVVVQQLNFLMCMHDRYPDDVFADRLDFAALGYHVVDSYTMNDVIKAQIQLKYGAYSPPLSEQEYDSNHDLLEDILPISLLQTLCQRLGISINDTKLAQLQSQKILLNTSHPIMAEDITNIHSVLSSLNDSTTVFNMLNELVESLPVPQHLKSYPTTHQARLWQAIQWLQKAKQYAGEGSPEVAFAHAELALLFALSRVEDHNMQHQLHLQVHYHVKQVIQHKNEKDCLLPLETLVKLYMALGVVLLRQRNLKESAAILQRALSVLNATYTFNDSRNAFLGGHPCIILLLEWLTTVFTLMNRSGDAEARKDQFISLMESFPCPATSEICEELFGRKQPVVVTLCYESNQNKSLDLFPKVAGTASLQDWLNRVRLRTAMLGAQYTAHLPFFASSMAPANASKHSDDDLFQLCFGENVTPFVQEPFFGVNTKASADDEKNMFKYDQSTYGDLYIWNRFKECKKPDFLDPIPADRKFSQVSACGDGVVAVDDKGTTYAVGRIAYFMGLENDQTQSIEDRERAVVLTRVPAMANKIVRQVSLSFEHGAFVTQDGSVFTFGSQEYGQLGHGDVSQRRTPRLVEHLQGFNVVQAFCTRGVSHFRTREGEVYSCGHNDNGQLGVGDLENKTLPTKMKTIRPIIDISGSDMSTLLITNSGNLLRCGEMFWMNTLYEKISVPFLVLAGSDTSTSMQKFVQVSCNCTGAFMLLTVEGKVYTCGRGEGSDAYQLGHGTKDRLVQPKKVEALNDVNIVYISSDERSSWAISNQGALYCWGIGGFGKNLSRPKYDNITDAIPDNVSYESTRSLPALHSFFTEKAYPCAIVAHHSHIAVGITGVPNMTKPQLQHIPLFYLSDSADPPAESKNTHEEKDELVRISSGGVLYVHYDLPHLPMSDQLAVVDADHVYNPKAGSKNLPIGAMIKGLSKGCAHINVPTRAGDYALLYIIGNDKNLAQSLKFKFTVV